MGRRVPCEAVFGGAGGGGVDGWVRAGVGEVVSQPQPGVDGGGGEGLGVGGDEG